MQVSTECSYGPHTLGFQRSEKILVNFKSSTSSTPTRTIATPPRRQLVSSSLSLSLSLSLAKMAQSSSSSPKNNNKAVQLERIRVQNKYGENLVGLLHETGSPQLVILCHGFQSTKEYTIMVNLADTITNEGISAFRFDFAGNGESEGSFQFGNYLREVDDLRSVVQYFSGGKHATITILGHSKGGNVVLLYASKYHDVPTIVNISGRYNLENGLKDRLGKDFMQNIMRDGFIDIMSEKGEVEYRVTEESLNERLSTDMHAACLSIEKCCRVLTVHGSSDEIIPVEDAFEFSKIISNHKLQIIEGANHGYSKHQAELAEVVSNFIKTSLQEGRDVISQ